MFKKCLENRIVYQSPGYKCYLCHHEIQDENFFAVETHIGTDKHQQRINEIDKTMRAEISQKLETISEKNLEIIAKNQVTTDVKHNFLYCHVCKCSICGISNTLEHIIGYRHTRNYLSIEKETQSVNRPINSSTNQVGFNNLSDHITFDEQLNLFKCHACDCYLNSSIRANEHMQSKFHIIMAALTKNKTINTLDKQLIDHNVSGSTESKDDFIEIRFCMPCQVKLKNTTMLQFHNLMHFYKDVKTPLILDIIKYEFDKNGKPIIKCLICNAFLSNNEYLYQHFESPLHLDRLEFFNYIKDDIELDNSDNQIVDKENLEKMNFKPPKHISKALLCTLCDVPLLSKAFSKEIHVHQKGKRHQNKSLLHLENKIKKINNKSSISDNPNLYACYMCEKSFINAEDLLDHYEGKKHKLKMKCFMLINKNLYITLIKVNGKQVANCKLCQNYMPTCRNAIEHILGKNHMEKEENSDYMKDIYETSTEELLKLGFSVENLNSGTLIESNSLDVDDMLNDLITLDLTVSQEKRLTRSLRARQSRIPNVQGKRTITSFNENAYIWGKSYIKYCLDSGVENIYNIDPEKFRLLKLGTTLIFPWENEHACLVCGEQFGNQQILFEHLQDAKHIENLQQMEESSKEFQVYDDQFSDLELAKNYMQEESNDWVHCYACENNVKNDNTSIRLHIEESNHINRSQVWTKLSEDIYKNLSAFFEEAWYYAQVFVCDICKTKNNMEIDFVMHLETQTHLENVTKSLQKGIVAKFDICPACITYWYASVDFYNVHCKDPYHKRFAKNGDFTVPNMTLTALDLLKNIDEQIDFLRNESNTAVLEKYKETELLKAIEETVESIYPNAKAHTFGSRLSQLGFVDSDVDVFLDCDNLYYNRTSQDQSQQYLTSVKKNFETQRNIWIVDEVLLVTRVPILKLRHIPTRLKCDISFINGLSVEKSKLIGFYNTAYPICRELILYLKRWLTLCRITGSDCITTFAISWYVIFYLQIKGILPSVYELIQLKNESKIVDGWECGFLDNFSANHSDLNFSQHLKGFFNYYAEFDYHTNVACPYLGKVIKKHIFAHINELPIEMQIYKHRLQVNYAETFRFESPMCIQDPIELSQNITKAVKKHHLRCFRQYCTDSAAKC